MYLHEIPNKMQAVNSENFEHIYLHYFPRLLRFAKEYVIVEEDAQNITQDIFLALWERRGEMEIHISLTAYLFTLVKNRCIDHLRRKTNAAKGQKSIQEAFMYDLQIKLYSLELFDQAILSEEHIEEIIRNAIQSLPEKCREIFIKSKIEGKKYKDVAKELHISVNTVEGQMSIALRKLREELKAYIPLLLFLI